MRILLYFTTIFYLLAACTSSKESANGSEQDQSDSNKPKVAIAGIAIESSTFSPALSYEDAFHKSEGEEMYKNYPFLTDDSTHLKRADWYPAMYASAIPGGAVPKETYESLVTQILEKLEKNLPYDGLYLDIHGAMSVVGLDDPEGDFITRVRDLVGMETLISTSMDLHGNVTQRLAKNSDLITCFRMAPHEDRYETKERAVDNLLTRLEKGLGKPAYKAWIPVPILLPGEQTSTRVEPAKSLYDKIPLATQPEGVIDASIWIGYAWADEPRNHATIMTYGDDKEAVTKAAEELAQSLWSVREEFDFVAPTASLEEALDSAVASDKVPFIISDSGDNPTAGGAGDVTWTITEILKRPEFKKEDGPSLIYASIPGPNFIAKAVEIGVGGEIDATAGADVDDRFAPPVRLKGTIEAIEHGDRSAETVVVVKTGSAHVIVTKKRKPYHYIKDFTDVGLNPKETDIVVVKIGYLVPELYDIRADWIMALTPGGVDQYLERLEYKRINRPMYPFDKDMDTPNLKARLIPLSQE
ncbi:M81 family metallopeptidase [Fulvivirga maritima]|uniref:M81 family metallopeptidase n=1 Tax=Fulvivirga maritima TaxID=2904247 RepID=UPI001F45A720|nr:M81 family metallopeptidase [Fulvivirga maritima]UII25792.1 M81 family metallopeptidase [Fulvivirga maritima]